MLLSVVIPFYHVEAYIGACLDAAMQLPAHACELLLVDDCGTDGSAAIAQEYAAAHSNVRLIRREKKRRGDSSLDDEEGALTLPADPAPTPHQAIEQKELHQAVAEGLAQLSEEHRQVLVMREINGLSYEQIGSILDLSPGTVKSRIARARISLAKFLQKTGNFSE